MQPGFPGSPDGAKHRLAIQSDIRVPERDGSERPETENDRTEETVRATLAACQELLLPDTTMNPDAVHTILAMIATWGVPILRIDDAEAARTWLWSDLHLHDPASVRHHGRPFWCRHTHDRRLKRRWRRTVSPTDTIIHAGDLAPETFGERRRRRLLDSLPGWKINILGNHDVQRLHAPLTAGWNETHGALVITSDPPLVVTHCPLRTVPAGAVNTHGHMHQRHDQRFDPRINIAVQHIGYRPVSASTLAEEAARRLAGKIPRRLDTGPPTATEDPERQRMQKGG